MGPPKQAAGPPPSGPPSSVLVLDTGAILEGANLVARDCRTSPEVVAEIQPGGAGHRRLETLQAAGLQVQLPTDASRDRVAQVSKEAGNWARLSAADVSILALALDVAPATLVSDDFTVLDVARRLKLPVLTVRTGGVTATKDWVGRCHGCRRTYPAARAGGTCDVCGREIRLKPTR